MNRVLIVEDEPDLASFFRKALQKNGFSITVAPDGEQALQAIQANDYDVILLDIGLPIKNGWIVLKELREQCNDCPVIVATASDSSLQEALKAGANDYLQKPIRLKALLSAVQKQISSILP